HFANCDFVMKADDDVFLRVPQLVSDLRSVHPTIASRESSGGGGGSGGLYWGLVMSWMARKGGRASTLYFARRLGLLLSHDVVALVNSHAPLQEHCCPLIASPGGGEVDGDDGGGGSDGLAGLPKDAFKAHNMDHEDVMVGRALYEIRTAAATTPRAVAAA